MFDAFTDLMRMARLPNREKVHKAQAQGCVGLIDPTAPIRVPLHWLPAPEASPDMPNDKPRTTP